MNLWGVNETAPKGKCTLFFVVLLFILVVLVGLLLRIAIYFTGWLVWSK